MKMRRFAKFFLLMLVVGLLSVTALAADAIEIKESGTYTYSGAIGNIIITGVDGDVTLNFNGITMDTTETAIDASGLTGDLTINLTGTNKITTSGVGIQVQDGQDLTIQGDGTLSITSNGNGISGGGTSGSATFTDNASVNVKADGEYGITDFGTVIISGTYTQVTAEGTTAAISVTKLEIAEGIVILDGDGNEVTVSGGELVDGESATITSTKIGTAKAVSTNTAHRYVLTVIEGEGGEISPYRGFKYSIGKGGDSNDFKFTPDEGYEIYDVLVDGESIGVVDGYQFIDVRKNHTLEVQFALDSTYQNDEDDSADLDPDGTQDGEKTYPLNYDEDTFEPDEPITRAEIVALFAQLMGADLDGETVYVSAFDDVTDDMWYAQCVAFLEENGIIIGYPDNTFRGENDITRAEFAAVVSRYLGMELTDENDCTDVADDHWAVAYINGAIDSGWMQTSEDGTFAPEQAMRGAEVMVQIMAVAEA